MLRRSSEHDQPAGQDHALNGALGHEEGEGVSHDDDFFLEPDLGDPPSPDAFLRV